MKSNCTLWVFVVISTLSMAVIHMEETDSETQNHPIYKYGYVVAHKNGGSQAHMETRNGNMTLGKYYVNFPNGSGQKVTYLADDVGFHTGVVYSSQTKKGSTKTRIAMGHKALATLDNLEGPQGTILKTKPATTYSAKYANNESKAPISKLLDQTVSNYTPSKNLYSLHKPVESVTKASDLTGLLTGSPDTYTEILRNTKREKATHSRPENLSVDKNPPENHASKQNSNDIYTATPSTSQNSAIRPTYNHSTVVTDQKSIEKTILFDLDAQLISKIQKHADEIIMKDLRKDAARQQLVYGVTPKLALSMQPIVVTSTDEKNKVEFDSENIKSNKKTQSGTENSIPITKKINGSDYDQISKTSGVYEIAINYTKPTKNLSGFKVLNSNSIAADSRSCRSNSCTRDNDRAFSNSIVPIKTLANNALETGTSNSRKSAANFYPKNQLHREMHFVTTIDVQKGISLDVQQNEDGSIRLANNFPFNKLPNYQRPYNAPTLAPILSNSVTPNTFPITHNAHLSSKKTYFGGPGTVAPSDIAQETPLRHDGSLFKQKPPEKIELVYNLPQAIPSGIPGDVKDVIKPINNHNIPQELHHAEQLAVYDADQQRFEQEQRKQNSIEKERTEYFKNLKKVEEITQQNSAPRQPESEIPLNVLTEDVTVNPLLQIESNSIKPVTLNTEGQEVYGSEVNTANYQNDVSDYAIKVPVTYPTVQEIQTPVVYQKPVFSYAPQFQEYPVSAESEELSPYYESQQIPNILLDNSSQQIPENADKINLIQYAKVPQDGSTIPYAFSQPLEAEEKIEQFQQLTLPEGQINQISLSVQPGFLHQPKHHEFDKTLLLNPVMAVDYGKAFKVDKSVPLLSSYPTQIEAESETVSVPSIYPVPQEYQLSVPIQLSQAVSLPETFSPPSFSVPASSPEYHVTMSYKPQRMHQNKLRVQPLKPSPPAEDEIQMESIRSLLSQPEFNPTYLYAGFPAMNRLQLRHIGHKKRPGNDQVAAQSMRREKSLKNLKIEYGFKPPLRPSEEFSEEVKPSIYGPSVPLR